MLSDLSDQHIRSARHFAALASELEDEGVERWGGDRYERVKGYAIGAVLTSVAFLEARINEIFSHCGDLEWSHHLPASWPEGRRIIGRLRPHIERKSSLSKYEIALAACRASPWDRDKAPYAEAKLLVRLRNALTHYEPEWVNLERVDGRPVEQKQQHGLERALRGQFDPMRGAHEGQPYWPERCLGAG